MPRYDIQNLLLPVETSKDSLGGKPLQMTTRYNIMAYLDGRKIRCYPPETSSVYEHGGYVSYLYASNEFSRTTDYFYTAGDSLTAFDIVITEVEEDKNNPTKFLLSQNYPNPFNPSTKIRITILAGVETRRGVSLRVFEILSNEVATLVNEEKPAGENEVEFPNNIVRQAAS